MDRLAARAGLPRFTAERCVHGWLASASCRRCVEACPHGAWVIDEEQLGIDESRCQGCGACVAACPEQAIALDFPPPPRRRWHGGPVVLAACIPSGWSRAEGALPCLGALGLSDLTEWVAKGIGRGFFGRGDCPNCPQAVAGLAFQNRLASFNGLLAGRGLARLETTWCDTDTLLALLDTSQPDGGPEFGRRAFLRNLLGSALEKGLDAAGLTDGGGEGITPPGCRLPRSHEAEPAFFTPAIEAEHCNACGACLRLCPHGAMAFDGESVAYRIDADRCTGCGLCVDVCDLGAVCLLHWLPPPQSLIPLHTARCRACGITFHAPKAQGEAKDHCPRCAQHGHHRNLFQVLE